MPTTNPVPSQDPSDLLFNAGKLDEALNGTGTSFTDRLGTARRTVAGMNADFDAQLADAESDLNVYRADAAASAAQALGYLNTIRTTSYGAYAGDPATDPLGNPPNVGDEYFNTTSNLLKRFNGTTWQASDINTANLAAPSGSSLVGYMPSGTGAVATDVESKLREIEVSITDQGAVLDGVSDISAALQKALDVLRTTGGKLVIPASPNILSLNAAVSVTMAANTKLTIECHSKIACNALGKISITGDVANPDANAGAWVGTTELVVLGLNMSASATSIGTNVGLYVTGMKKVTLSCVVCKGFSYNGIQVLQSEDVSVFHCSGHGNMYAGLQYGTINGMTVIGGSYSNNGDPTAVPNSMYGYGVAGSTGSSNIYPSKNILITGVTANKNLRKGLDFHAGVNVRVIGNTVIGYGSVGIYAICESTGKTVSNVTISNNVIDGSGNTVAGATGIEFGTYGTSVPASGEFKVFGNTLIGAGTSSGRSIICTNAASGVQIESVDISNNTIRDGASATTEIIKVYTTAGLRAKKATISGNTIHSASTTYPIYVDGVGTSVMIDGNHITVDSGTVTMGIYALQSGSISCQISNNLLLGGATYTAAVIDDMSVAGYTTRNNTLKGVPVRDVYSSGRSIEYGGGPPATGYYRQGSIVWSTGVGPGGIPGWMCVASGTTGTWKAMPAVAA